jgi:outer membrane receptor protein involved in Fe transport
MTFRRIAVLLAIVLGLLFPAPAVADDLADEADLHFRIATEKYAARDFRTALEHFLLSNRLVPNRNVVFNIARSYEQLSEFPDAFRYYTQVLDMSPDEGSKQRAEESLARIKGNVAVLNVRTEPAGATVYINRRDLGPRGQTPRSLGFPAGKYKVIVDLPGYEPTESGELDISAGQQRDITLQLKLIVGTLRVAGDTGVTVRVDSPTATPSGVTPVDLVLPPGRHRLFLEREGHQSSEREVEVLASKIVASDVTLAPTTGTLVVNADEQDALVEVDGRPMGFTPAVITVQSGRRKVRVSLRGFRPNEREVDVRANEQTRADYQLRQVEEVEAASRTAEAVEDAPGSVSIIPGQELRAMGYPTVTEALRGVRGLYVSDDSSYTTIGVRGFARLGDYGNRVLTLLNGQALNDDWLGSSFLGYDALVDLEDVERIEVVRGPGSVLYGTGAFSGVVNIVTRGRPNVLGASVGAATQEDGLFRARVSASLPISQSVGGWITVAGAHSQGRDYRFPALVTPPSISAAGLDPGFDGVSRGSDGMDAGTVTGGFFADAFTLRYHGNFRTKSLAGGTLGTIVGDPTTKFTDGRGFVEAKFEPKVTSSLTSMTRAVLNHYRFEGTYAYVGEPEPQTSNERFLGWWGTFEQRLVYSPVEELRITAGGEVQLHKTAANGVFTDCTGGACLDFKYLPNSEKEGDDKRPFEIYAGYALADLAPSPELKLSAGVRVDYYSTFGSSGPSPRVAIVTKPYEQGVVKLLGGRAFRAPSIFEQFYQDGLTITPNLEIEPETVWSGELEYSHRFSTTVVGTMSGFANYIDNLISLRATGPEPDALLQYDNTGAPVLSLGGEAELRREWRQGWMASASYSLQRSKYQEEKDDPVQLREVPNSPVHMFSFRGAIPVVGRLATLGTRVTLESGRYDRHEEELDPIAQSKTSPSVVWDVVLSGEVERGSLRYNVGVYNVINYQYELPVSANFPMDTVPQRGRSFMASASVAF